MCTSRVWSNQFYAIIYPEFVLRLPDSIVLLGVFQVPLANVDIDVPSGHVGCKDAHGRNVHLTSLQG